MTNRLSYCLVFTWVFLYLTVLPSASSTMCYTCYSTKSWTSCYSTNFAKVDCSTVAAGHVTCVKQYVVKPGPNNTHITEYVKRCGIREACEEIKNDCRSRRYHCEAYCCHSDLCNKSYSLFKGFSSIIYVFVAVFVYSCFVL